MIFPTVGRVVHFHRSPNNGRFDAQQPLAAIVTFVHNNGLVNLAVFDFFGCVEGKTSILLLQDDEQPPESGPYAEWMPYQKQVSSGEPPLRAQPPLDAIGRWLTDERENPPTLHQVTKAAVQATAALVTLDENALAAKDKP